jgi:hypothetical protein
MVLILLSIIFTAVVVVIPRLRHRIALGEVTRSEIVKDDFSIARNCAQQSRVAGRVKRFLVVVLPDGKVVNPLVADRF